MRGVRLAIEEVDDIEEAFQSTVLEVLTDGNEDGRDTGGDTDGVLNVEVLKEEKIPTVRHHVIEVLILNTYSLNTSLAPGLWVRAAIKGLESEGGSRADIGTCGREELLYRIGKFRMKGYRTGGMRK